VFDDGKVSLFQGTYQDFLDRIGWKNENGSTLPKDKMTVPTNQPVNEKHRRRIRAELINEKSRTLGALQRKIDELEKEIISLEQKTEQDNRDLIEASLKSNGNTIKKLSKTIHDSQSKIESLFLELELMHVELNNKTKEFNEKVIATSEP
jgi:ATP-binding cassette subfamily F protein 3